MRQKPVQFISLGTLNRLGAGILLLAISISSINAYSDDSKMRIDSAPYGKTADGQNVTLYTLVNTSGNTVEMIDYGAIVVSINVPDRNGKRTNVTAGFASLDGYLQRHPYFGSTVGRFCNRIAKGKFSIDGKTYSLAINNGPNHLHGGEVGFDKLIWRVSEKLTSENRVGLRFSLTSPDGQEGYPGTLNVVADYVWGNDNTLTIHFTATTDKATHVNLTNHAYFNLSGAGSGTVYKHELALASDQYLAVDENMIPTGKTPNVKGTPLDFLVKHPIGDKIQELGETKGYDHCFVVRGETGKLRLAANVVDPASGRSMEVRTTQPGIQLYTGNFLDGTPGNAGFKQHEAFCLETQHFPDAPNQSSFLTTLLKPSETLNETTSYQFGLVK
jgi:aldose 1-epimerase